MDRSNVLSDDLYAKFFGDGGSESKSGNKKWIVLIAVGVVLVIVVGIVIKRSLRKKPEKAKEATDESDLDTVIEDPETIETKVQPQEHGPTLMLFYTTGCVHSRNMLPAWREAAGVLESKGVTVLEVLDPEAHKQHGIQKVPTIHFHPNGVGTQPVYVYNGDRSPKSFIDFVFGNAGPSGQAGPSSPPTGSAGFPPGMQYSGHLRQ